MGLVPGCAAARSRYSSDFSSSRRALEDQRRVIERDEVERVACQHRLIGCQSLVGVDRRSNLVVAGDCELALDFAQPVSMLEGLDEASRALSNRWVLL